MEVISRKLYLTVPSECVAHKRTGRCDGLRTATWIHRNFDCLVKDAGYGGFEPVEAAAEESFLSYSTSISKVLSFLSSAFAP
jgi:hypothetical protein